MPEVAVAFAEAGPQVTIDNFAFSPALLTVTVGTTVTWTNHDDIVHTVTALGGRFHSDPLDTDDHFSYQFTSTGVYTYFCSIHPHMIAHIVVR
jgi:plastocyanin